MRLLLKPTKTTKQKRNRDLAEFYGRKWSEVLKTKGLSESSLFLLERKNRNDELRKNLQKPLLEPLKLRKYKARLKAFKRRLNYP